MRYFTKQLWRDAQSPTTADDAHSGWQKALAEYTDQLEGLRERLTPYAFNFFANVDVHDAALVSLAIHDASRPAPRSEPPRIWGALVQNPVSVRLSVLDAAERFLWSVHYASMRRVVVDFPSDDRLFYSSESGFDDMGYHEVTDAGDGFLRHELLFSSGATDLFEFREVQVTGPVAVRLTRIANRMRVRRHRLPQTRTPMPQKHSRPVRAAAPSGSPGGLGSRARPTQSSRSHR